MNRTRLPLASSVVLLVGMCALLYPREHQLRNLADRPGTSNRSREEILAVVGARAEEPPPAILGRVDQRLQSAQARFDRGERETCLADLRAVVEDPEAAPDEMLRAVRFAVWLGRRADAARFCDAFRVRFGFPQDAGGLEQMAHAYADAGENVKAADTWIAAYRVAETDGERRRALEAVAALDPSEVSVRLHDEYLDSADDTETRLHLARLCQGMGLTGRYLEQLEEILRRDPARNDLRGELVWGRAANGEYALMLPHLRTLRERGASTKDLDRLYLLALLATGRADEDVAALALGAEDAFGEGRTEQCLEFVRRISAHPRASADDVFRGAQLALWTKAAPDAARLCDALLERFGAPAEPDRLRVVAQIYADNGESAKSARLWAALYRSEPDDAGRRRSLEALAALDSGPLAMELHEDYLSRAAGALDVRERYARLLQADGRMGPYLRQLEAILRLDASRHELREELVRAYASTRDYEQAVPHLEELRRRGGDRPELRELYLTALEETGRLDEFEAEVRRLGGANGRNPAPARSLAEYYESRQQLEKAADVWTRVFELEPGNDEPGARAAAIFELAGRWDDARRVYGELRRRSPQNREWALKLEELHDPGYERAAVNAAFAAKNYPEAIRAGADLLAHVPGDASILRLVADSCRMTGDQDGARRYYRALEKIAPDDYEVAYRIAACSEALNDAASARPAAARALKLLRGLPATRSRDLVKALSLVVLQRRKEARPILLKLLREDPKDAAEFPMFAWALLDLKEHRMLEQLIRKWGAVEPRSADLRHVWALLLIREGRPEEAVGILRARPGEEMPASLREVYLETLLDLGRWMEVQEELDRQEPDDSGTAWIRETIRDRFGPKGVAAASYYSARTEDQLRLSEGYRVFVAQHLWLAEKADYASLFGRIASLKRDEEVGFLRGGLELGYRDGAGLQAFGAAGAWEGFGPVRVWGAVGGDYVAERWTASLEAEVDRPWDTMIEAAAFDGIEDRLCARGSWALDPLFAYGSVRLSRYEIGNGRGLLTPGETAGETAVFGRLEYKVAGARPTLSAGFFDENLRVEKIPGSALSVVYQFGSSRFSGPEQVLAAIPVIRRSQPNQIGLAGEWVAGETTAVGGEFLVGGDGPRGLSPGQLYGGAARLIQDLGESRLSADIEYTSEQPEEGGSSAWLFQISLSTKF